MLTIAQGVMWILSRVFSFMGAKEDEKRWLTEASDSLHQLGWQRKAMLLDLEERQIANAEKAAREFMKQKEETLEPLRFSPKVYDMPKIVEVDADVKTQGFYKTRHKNARGLVVHYTAGRMEGGEINAIATLKDMAKRGLGCLVMDKDGVIYRAKNQALNEVAFHAGVSEWKGLKGISQYCIGMEICCPGLTDANGKAWFGSTYTDLRTVNKEANRKAGTYVKFTQEQEKALVDFILWQADVNPDFDLDWVVGHDEIAPGRKSDPGGSLSVTMPAFRWMLKQKIATR